MIAYKVKVWPSGNKEWFLNGKKHREDGPAVERANGAKEWWLNGKQHREDGPAIEYYDGYKAWFLNGQQLTEDEHWLVTPTKPPSTPCAQTLSGKVVEIDGKKYKLTEV
jgi:hypothetical protein